MAEAPACPECGGSMVLRQTDKYKWKNGEGRMFYGCSGFPYCRGLVGAHPGGKPYEDFVRAEDAEHKLLRTEGHSLFDPIFKDGYLSRGMAVALLADCLDIDVDRVHFSQFSKAQCAEAVRHLGYFWETDPKPTQDFLDKKNRPALQAQEFAEMLDECAAFEVVLENRRYNKIELRNAFGYYGTLSL